MLRNVAIAISKPVALNIRGESEIANANSKMYATIVPGGKGGMAGGAAGGGGEGGGSTGRGDGGGAGGDAGGGAAEDEILVFIRDLLRI